MKKALFTLFMLCSPILATEYTTVYNLSGYRIDNFTYYAAFGESPNTFTLEAGSSVWVPRESFFEFTALETTYGEMFGTGGAYYPIVYIDTGLSTLGAGEWDESKLADGFGLGCSIAGIMLTFYIVGLLKRPVVEN